MFYISVITVFFSVFILAYMLISSLLKSTFIIEGRIEQLKDLHTKDNANDSSVLPFKSRILIPVYNSFIQILLKLTPGRKISSINKKLEKSGLNKNCTVEKWLFVKTAFALIISILTGALIYKTSNNAIFTGLFIALSLMLVNTVLDFYLSRKIELRKKKLLKDLPYTMDLITVSIEAGLSFDGAMERVVENVSGVISDEFIKCLKEIRMGIQRKTALKNMSTRCDAKELSMLVTSIIQADDLGVSLSRVLRIESSNLREERKQLAREKAMKAPIKMLFPLVFFIFPSIFIIILGPALIKITEVFSK
jgi:tight adherence protein C